MYSGDWRIAKRSLPHPVLSRTRKGQGEGASTRSDSLLKDEVRPPIPLPGRFVVADHEGPFLSVTDDLDPIDIDPRSDEIVLGRLGAPLAEARLYSLVPRSSQ